MMRAELTDPSSDAIADSLYMNWSPNDGEKRSAEEANRIALKRLRAIPDTMTAGDNAPTGIVYGFLRDLIRLLATAEPTSDTAGGAE